MFEIEPCSCCSLEPQPFNVVYAKPKQESIEQIRSIIDKSIPKQLQPKLLMSLLSSYQNKKYKNIILEKPTTVRFETDSIVLDVLPIVRLFPFFPIDRVKWDQPFQYECTHESILCTWQQISTFEKVKVSIIKFQSLSTLKFNKIFITFEYENTNTNQLIRVFPCSCPIKFPPPLFMSYYTVSSIFWYEHSFDDFPSQVAILDDDVRYYWSEFGFAHRPQKPTIISILNMSDRTIYNLQYGSDINKNVIVNSDPSFVALCEKEDETTISMHFFPPFLQIFQQKFIQNDIPQFVKYNPTTGKRFFSCQLMPITVSYLQKLSDVLVTCCIDFHRLDKDTLCHILHFVFPECPLSLLYLFYSLVFQSIHKYKPIHYVDKN